MIDSKKLKFAILQITYWCSFASFTSFMAAYMQSKGMPVTVLGLMLTVNTLLGFIGSLVGGIICDKFKTNKGIFLITSVLIFLIEICIFRANTWYAVIIGFGILGFLQQPLAVILDTWILKTFWKTPQDYGPIRSAGSIGYAIFIFFYGNLLEKQGYHLMLIFSAVFLGSGMMISLFVQDVSEISNKSEKRILNSKGLLGNRQYLFTVILLFGAGIASAPIMQLISVLMDNVGGTVSHVGYALFANAIMQVPGMLLAGKMQALSAKAKILFAAFLYMIAVFGLSIGNSPNMLLAFCCIGGIAYGVLLPSVRELVFRIVPKDINTTAQGVCDAVFMSLGGMVSNFTAGFLIENFNVTIMLWIFGCIEILTVLLFLFETVRNSVEFGRER